MPFNIVSQERRLVFKKKLVCCSRTQVKNRDHGNSEGKTLTETAILEFG